MCKIFDSYTSISISLIYLLHQHYDIVYITKPFTSRAANSEKYLVCKGFKGISTHLLRKLYIIINLWNSISEENRTIYQIINYNTIPETFKKTIKRINSIFFEDQSKNIIKTINMIELFSKNLDYESMPAYKKIINYQTFLAFKWCKRYKCKINYNSMVNNINNNVCKSIKII